MNLKQKLIQAVFTAVFLGFFSENDAVRRKSFDRGLFGANGCLPDTHASGNPFTNIFPLSEAGHLRSPL